MAGEGSRGVGVVTVGEAVPPERKAGVWVPGAQWLSAHQIFHLYAVDGRRHN